MKKISVFLIAVLITGGSCRESKDKKDDLAKFRSVSDYGQFAPADAWDEDSAFAYYGSENEWNRRMFSERTARIFYKRRGQRELLAVLDGNVQGAIDECKAWIEKEPDDLESMFVLSIAYVKAGEMDKAFQTAASALAKGLPFERFLAGPKDLLRPLYSMPQFQKLQKEKKITLIHGPLLGKVTDTSAAFWVRTNGEDTVTVQCYVPGKPDMIKRAFSISQEEKDFTAVIDVDGLKSNTEYLYDIFINGRKTINHGFQRFTTYPAVGEPGKVVVGIGGGAGYTPQYEHMWKVIKSHDLQAMMLLGDNVYIDLPEMPGPFHDYTYYRRQSQPFFREMVASTPVYAIWDDHDAAIDDVWLGPYTDKPKWKMPMLDVFLRNWNNPPSGSKDFPACWYSFKIGDVEFFLLDGRTYRTNPFKEEKTMLGPVQKEWLMEGLRNSTAAFKVIVSPVPWTLKAKPGSHDTWAGFPEERMEIFSFLTKNNIKGALLFSADRHRTDFWKIERDNDYPLYEFTSSRLTNIHTANLMEGALFGYNEKCSFGKITFNTEIKDPEVIFEIVNIDNEVVHSYVLKLSELR